MAGRKIGIYRGFSDPFRCVDQVHQRCRYRAPRDYRAQRRLLAEEKPLFSWFRTRRRRRWLAQPFPEDWEQALRQGGAHYRVLDPSEQAKLRDDARVFVNEVSWEGCAGLELDDRIRITIAAQACLLILGLDLEYYRDVETLLVYPSGFRARERQSAPGGVVVEESRDLLGEAVRRGPVILSWHDAQCDGRRHDGQNLVLHEFAHVLDMRNGEPDGIPPLESAAQVEIWKKTFEAEYARHVDAVQRGRPTLLDPYGAEDRAEFFAVATESFFEQPQPLRRRHPALYDQMREFYRQDPAQRFDRAGGSRGHGE